MRGAVSPNWCGNFGHGDQVLSSVGAAVGSLGACGRITLRRLQCTTLDVYQNIE